MYRVERTFNNRWRVAHYTDYRVEATATAEVFADRRDADAAALNRTTRLCLLLSSQYNGKPVTEPVYLSLGDSVDVTLSQATPTAYRHSVVSLDSLLKRYPR